MTPRSTRFKETTMFGRRKKGRGELRIHDHTQLLPFFMELHVGSWYLPPTCGLGRGAMCVVGSWRKNEKRRRHVYGDE